MSSHRSASRFAHASAFAYIASMFMPALVVLQKPVLWGKPTEEVLFGGQCLILGVFYWPGWLANPLLAIAAICYLSRRPDIAIGFLIPALVSAWLALAILSGDSSHRLLYPHVGYVAWVASLVCLTIASFLRLGYRRSR